MRVIWIASILFLAACVPIEQPQRFFVPPPETKAGLSDLAEFLATSEEQGEASDEYMSVLTEFYECLSETAWEQNELSDQQAMASVFWMTGFGMAISMLDREEQFESGNIDQYHEEGFEDAGDRPFYQSLLWTVEYFCYE